MKEKKLFLVISRKAKTTGSCPWVSIFLLALLPCYLVTLLPCRAFALEAIKDIGGVEEMEVRAEEQMRPYGLGEKVYNWWLCRLTWVPVLGSRLDQICRLRQDSEDVGNRLGPYLAQVTPPAAPETLATASAEGQGEVFRAQGVLDLISWLLEIIGGFTFREKGQWRTFWASQQEELGSPEMKAMSENSDTEKEIVGGAYTTQKTLLPYRLSPIHGQMPLPPELEPTPLPLPSGVPTPTPLPSGQPTLTPIPSGGLWYTINHRDSSVVLSDEKKEEIVNLVLKYWPNSKIKSAWDYVEKRAIENGWNPSFVIALWIEESGASGVHAWDVGCTGAPQDNLSAGLDCLFGLPYSNKPFPEFLCTFSEGHYPCDFSINPNFPKNLKAWYDRLVPSRTPGASQPF